MGAEGEDLMMIKGNKEFLNLQSSSDFTFLPFVVELSRPSRRVFGRVPGSETFLDATQRYGMLYTRYWFLFIKITSWYSFLFYCIFLCL